MREYTRIKYDHGQSLKGVAKHLLLRSGLENLMYMRRHMLGMSTKHLEEGDMSRAFSDIYNDGVWTHGTGGAVLSGPGSTDQATSDLRVQLSQLLDEIHCQRLVDIGCGDFNWMRHVKGSFDYLGLDVVPKLVESHNAVYGDATHHFLCMDAANSVLPEGDVALCREVLFHLSFRDVVKVLQNIKAAGFKYILITSDKDVWFNSDIRSGDFRRLNMMKLPFRLPQPIGELVDEKVEHGRIIGIWQGDTLPAEYHHH